MRTSWPREPAAFLTQAWNLPAVEGVHAPPDLRVGKVDHGSAVKGSTLWGVGCLED